MTNDQNERTDSKHEPVRFREWHNVEAEREARARMPGENE